MKEAIGFAIACWLSGAILLLKYSAAAIALSGMRPGRARSLNAIDSDSEY
ncbi:hypothetical protein ACTMU2_04335 [Cupriavidus basilensis]